MSAKETKETGVAPARREAELSSFENLPVEGWFWELIRRDKRFRKRFEQIEKSMQEYAAARLSPDEYARTLKSYLAHLRRYGLRTSGPAAMEDLSRLIKKECYLLLPLPGRNRLLAAPRPDVSYLDFGEGLKPGPRSTALTKSGFNRLRIRKLLRKHGLLEKRETPEGAREP